MSESKKKKIGKLTKKFKLFIFYFIIKIIKFLPDRCGDKHIVKVEQRVGN